MDNHLRRPEVFREYPEALMSNFDRVIDDNVAEAIQNRPLYAQYAGRNFCGYVWRQDGKWHCEIWTYKSYCETFSADTLQEIMSGVSFEYGYE